jgi:phosphatidylinositol glycan class U
MFLLLKAIFHPLPTVVDVSLVVGIISIARRTVARMKIYSLIFFVAIPVPIGLYIVDYDLWLKSGSGNANYMFFQCLAYNLFVGVILLDFMASTLNRDKALVLTEKQNREVSLESTSTDAGANNDSNGSNIDDAKKKD